MSRPIRVLFLGTSAFAVPPLERLCSDPRFQVTLVITQPDRPVGRKQILTPPPVKVTAEQYGVPVWQPEKLNMAFADYIKDQKIDRPDFLIAVSYGQILSDAVLAFPVIAPINLHASLLPRWRGASPIQQSILSGDTETGVTVQRMVKELDAGPILAQQKIPLSADETTPHLHDALANLGADLLIETLIAPLHPVEQDATQVTFCKKLKREDGIVNPQMMTAEEIDRKVRALVPWPGVTMEIDGEILKILKTSLEPMPDASAFPCANNSTLYLVEVQPPSKKPMSGKMWMAGRHENQPHKP